MIQDSDIITVFSGGSINNIPEYSTGGNPSSFVLPLENHLFSNISPLEAENGFIDYRCIYIFNDSIADTFWNVKVFVDKEIRGGAATDLGFIFNSEVQKLILTGNVTGGSMTLSYESTSFSFDYNSNLDVWANNLQTAIRTIPSLTTVTVSVDQSFDSSNVPATIFTITYIDSRSHSIISIGINSLVPLPFTTIERLFSGNPINSIAQMIDLPTVAPTGVIFSHSNRNARLSIGNLLPNEGFPVWIRRTVLPNTLATSDGFQLGCVGTPFQIR